MLYILILDYDILNEEFNFTMTDFIRGNFIFKNTHNFGHAEKRTTLVLLYCTLGLYNQ